jgi:hypothetical protein
MPNYDNPLNSLAARVRGGDAKAVCGLRAALEPRMTLVVQQVLRTGPGRSPLDRRIAHELALSERTHPGGPRDRTALAAQVAQRLCAAVIDGLRANPRSSEALKDTVLDL